MVQVTIPDLKSFATDVKHRVRTEQRKFLRRTILRQKKPEDLHVLCLPSSEAREVFEIYDLLGIPRSNIVGVEREKERVEILQSRQLGIVIHQSELNDLLDQSLYTELYFDIVNLDYSGYYSKNCIEILEKILNQRLLADYSALMVTYKRSRENAFAKGMAGTEIFSNLLDQTISYAYKENLWHDGNARFGAGEVLQGDIHEEHFKERVQVDLLILSQLSSEWVADFNILDFTQKKGFTPTIKAMVTMKAAVISQAIEDGRSLRPLKIQRFKYQSGASPMRVINIELRRITRREVFRNPQTLLNVRRRDLPSCIPIEAPPKNTEGSQDEKNIKERIAEKIRLGEIIEN